MGEGKSAETRTSRVLSTFHFFLYCEEVEINTLCKAFSISKKTAYRDIRLLEQSGVLKAQFDRSRMAYVAAEWGELTMETEENRTRMRYLKKIRRICLWMLALEDWEGPEDNLIERYRHLFPAERDRTRQRDFEELRELGYLIGYSGAEADMPGGWYVEIPPAFCLRTIPSDVNWW